MSERNIELMRRVYQEFNARDIEEFIASCDPRIEFHSVFATVFGGVYDGHDGVRTFFRDLADAWDEIRAEPERTSTLASTRLSLFCSTGADGTATRRSRCRSPKWRAGVRVDELPEVLCPQGGGAARVGRVRRRAGADRAVMASANRLRAVGGGPASPRRFPHSTGTRAYYDVRRIYRSTTQLGAPWWVYGRRAAERPARSDPPLPNSPP
jgi:ketosteroid isomerase-like protein